MSNSIVGDQPRARRRATREDVARLAGTSPAVVSYVVNDGPRPVAPETRRRVLDAIALTGYRPNNIARALAAGATRTYGMIVPDISNPFFAALVHAVEDELFAAGRVLVLGDSAGSQERERDILTSLISQRVDGLLLVGVDDRVELGEQLDPGTPLVRMDRVAGRTHGASVSVDNRAAAALATRHLLEHGHREIALVGGPQGLSTAEERERGWREVLQAAGLPVRAEWMVRGSFTRQAGYEAGLNLLSAAHPRPASMFVASDQQALGVLRAAHELGLSVPGELAVITADGTDDCNFSVPTLSSVRQPIGLLAATAVALLLDGEPEGAQHVVVPAELVLRRSCGCESDKVD